MNNKKLIIVIVAVFAVLLIAALILYPKLKDSYAPAAFAPPMAETAPPIVADEAQEPDNAQDNEQDNEQDNAPAEQTVQLAPDFSATDINGNTVSLSDYFGKPIIVNFWATWCGPCKSELPAFDKAHAAYGEDITFLMVNLVDGYQETVEGTKSFVLDNGYLFPVYFDTEYSATYAYGVYSIPMTLFINPDGTLMDYRIGSMDEETVFAYAQRLLQN